MFVCDCPPDDCAKKVQLYLAGDRACGDVLAKKFTPLVRRIVQRVLGPQRRTDWEDACQAIFLRVFASLAQWEHRCPFCKWLAVVAARRAIDFTRAEVRMEPLPTAEFADATSGPPDQETLQRIGEIVGGFPSDWQKVWELFLQGMRRDVIAQQVGKSVRTVQYWLAEMLDQLRQRIGG
jgi:RNA polymerase sigma factor (sigma-70 family)